jgi:FdhD protein
MNNEVEKVPVFKFIGDSGNATEDVVVREFPLTIILDNRELVTLLCSPSDLNYLAVGFLYSEGLISSKDDIKRVLVDDVRGLVQVETAKSKSDTDEVSKRYIGSSGGRGLSFYTSGSASGLARVDSSLHVSASDIMSLHHEFQHRSEVFQATGGVHSAALCDAGHILVFSEDVGRHNAVDKVFGKCLMEDISTRDRIIAASCRISSEILLKVARRNIPILASKSAPTDLGVKLAKDLGVTLIGFVRGQRMNVYANEWRLNNA